jgi:hypothetical protein
MIGAALQILWAAGVLAFVAFSMLVAVLALA